MNKKQEDQQQQKKKRKRIRVKKEKEQPVSKEEREKILEPASKRAKKKTPRHKNLGPSGQQWDVGEK